MAQSLNNYIIRASIFLVAVFVIVVLLYPVLQNAFLSNIFINIIILLALITGIVFNFFHLKAQSQYTFSLKEQCGSPFKVCNLG